MWFYNVQQGFEIVPRSLRDQWDIEASFCVSFSPQNTHFSCWHRNGLKQCIHVKNWFQVFICLMKWNEMESYLMACQPCSYWVVSVWIGGEKGPEKVPCQRGSFLLLSLKYIGPNHPCTFHRAANRVVSEATVTSALLFLLSLPSELFLASIVEPGRMKPVPLNTSFSGKIRRRVDRGVQ